MSVPLMLSFIRSCYLKKLIKLELLIKTVTLNKSIGSPRSLFSAL